MSPAFRPEAERLAGEFEDIAVGLAESAELAGARADEADLERRLGARGESAVRAGGSRDACSAGGHNQPAPRYWLAAQIDDVGFGFHVFPPMAVLPGVRRISILYTPPDRQSKARGHSMIAAVD